jgi:hypothetical protein
VHVRWWLVVLLLGLPLCVVALTLVGGIAQFAMVSLGVLIALIAVDVWAGDRTAMWSAVTAPSSGRQGGGRVGRQPLATVWGCGRQRTIGSSSAATSPRAGCRRRG